MQNTSLYVLMIITCLIICVSFITCLFELSIQSNKPLLYLIMFITLIAIISIFVILCCMSDKDEEYKIKDTASKFGTVVFIMFLFMTIMLAKHYFTKDNNVKRFDDLKNIDQKNKITMNEDEKTFFTLYYISNIVFYMATFCLIYVVQKFNVTDSIYNAFAIFYSILLFFAAASGRIHYHSPFRSHYVYY